MGKFLEYEVVSPVEIVYPVDFDVVAKNIGERIFSVPTRSEIRMWSSGATFNANKSFYHPVKKNKLNYFHYAKVEKNIGTRSLDFMNIAARLSPSRNPVLLGQDYIGEEELNDTIQSRLQKNHGLCSLEDTFHEFEYVDVIDSEKEEDTKLFVLRQFNPKDTSNPLGTITQTARERINDASKDLTEVDFSTASALTDCIVFGSVENSPSPDAIEEFKETLTVRFQDSGAVKVKILGLEID
jgi:hypothetical protein